MAEKVDLKRTVPGYRARRGRFEELEVPERSYLMVDGHGDPNGSPDFTAAIETLYPVAYALKFGSRNDLGRDYVVPPLEGLWWAEDMAAFTTARDKSAWDWTLMLLVPDWLGEAEVDAAREKASAKRPPRLDDLRCASLAEGCCLQTLHVGSYDDEGTVLRRLHEEHLPAQGLRPTGTHHEIYLSDFRRVAPERRRTILRQPVHRAGDPPGH
ncbi:GyrI-like domain-containing protein [Nocardioides sambongensis]|uniref:GyrI-like domain-containing protein n=1 Tax=Nocardioides sambongensis TaxID=2589074 RepID=UPI00112E04AE|nr:GyrI-like domain-containing protein [Nocardioides sambongensis]